MPLGELIGRGVSSDVYAWTADTVVKLFKPQFESLAAGEFERTRAIHASDAPCPACMAGGGRGSDRADPRPTRRPRSWPNEAGVHAGPHPRRGRRPATAGSAPTRRHVVSWGIDGTGWAQPVPRRSSPGQRPASWVSVDGDRLVERSPRSAGGRRCVQRAVDRLPGHAWLTASVDLHRRRVRTADRYLDTYRELVRRRSPTFPCGSAPLDAFSSTANLTSPSPAR